MDLVEIDFTNCSFENALLVLELIYLYGIVKKIEICNEGNCIEVHKLSELRKYLVNGFKKVKVMLLPMKSTSMTLSEFYGRF